MTRDERKIAIIVLGLIALGALAIHFGKPRLGNPGLALERVPLTNEVGKVVRDERVRFPDQIPGFNSVNTAITDTEVTNLPPDTVYGRKLYFDNTGFGAQLSAVMMKTDRTSIHRPEVCVTGQGWKIQKSEIIDIPVALPTPYVLKATCLTSTKEVTIKSGERSGEKRQYSALYIYWFVSETRLVPGYKKALWCISEDLVTSGILYPWAYVSCFATCAPGNEGAALARMKRIISTSAPEFQLTPPNNKQTASLQPPLPVN